jgi:hypothetical protein
MDVTSSGGRRRLPLADAEAAGAVDAVRMRRIITIGLAIVAGLATWFLLAEVAGVDLVARTGPSSTTRISALSVAVTAAGVGFAAWALLAVLERVWPGRARLIWTITAGGVLAVSLLGPLGGVGGAAVAGLAALHLAVGLVLIAGLPRAAVHDPGQLR